MYTSFKGPQDRCSPDQQTHPARCIKTHTYWPRSKCTIAVFYNLTFKLKNSLTWVKLLLQLDSLLRCQRSSSKLAARAPELGPLFKQHIESGLRLVSPSRLMSIMIPSWEISWPILITWLIYLHFSPRSKKCRILQSPLTLNISCPFLRSFVIIFPCSMLVLISQTGDQMLRLNPHSCASLNFTVEPAILSGL